MLTVCIGVSFTTSRTPLSSRMPRNAGWRRRLSPVHSVNATCTTKRGLTHVADAEERGMAQAVVAGPLGERDLHHEARLDPRRLALARRVLRRRLRHDILRQLVLEPDALLGRKAGAHFARVVQRAVVAFRSEER